MLSGILDGNLYVGTSAAELLHFVSIPDEKPQNTTFILASRIEPSPTPSPDFPTGVRQIVILPSSSKACILCNGILTFRSLPELSPVGRKVLGCTWIGKDLNAGASEAHQNEEGDVIMICIKQRIRLIKVADDFRLVKNIDYPGCLATARRGRIACVANTQSYALLDVENMQKIPLFPISSLDKNATPAGPQLVEDVNVSHPSQPGRSSSGIQRRGEVNIGDRGHGRTTSLSAFVGGLGMRQGEQRPQSHDRSREVSPDPSFATSSPRQTSRAGPPVPVSQGKPLPPPPQPPPQPLPELSTSQEPGPSQPTNSVPLLKPNLISPIPTEFLLTTGTSMNEPGVGIFVNCDGDVVRGTLEFSAYPSSVVFDTEDPTDSIIPKMPGSESEIYILAAIQKLVNNKREDGIEIKAIDSASGEATWLRIPSLDSNNMKEEQKDTSIGLISAQTMMELNIPAVGEKLRAVRFALRTRAEGLKASPEALEREKQEDEFARRLGKSGSRIITWHGHQLSWVAKNPLIIQLDLAVERTLEQASKMRLNQTRLIQILGSVRNIEPRTETEFLSLEYIRQKISIILFADLAVTRHDVNPQFNEHLLIEGGADPRVILSMIPLLRKDIFETPTGIWVYAGVVSLIQERYVSTTITFESDEVLSRPEDYDVLSLIKRYLTEWRQRKGFGSIRDEAQVSATVDAALLHILLFQDQQSHQGPGNSTLLRTELHSVVDNNVNCFDHAVKLLEDYRRLYLLSRLYQSRRMSGQVLATWKRILEGEQNDGGGLADGEQEMRKYLVNRGNSSLVEEYGGWLARRNPKLGVQVFTDDNSRVKLPPAQVVQLLRQRAPDAVKVYLEHLVFGKNSLQYANDLISYYLDSVLGVLESSQEAPAMLHQTYETYKALEAPKPTYRQFIADNAISAPWWNDRLRLLELLGGTYGAGFSYDVASVLERMEPFEDALVPESIILEGRQGRHEQALRLLTHGLGDFHTAINYCLLGGSSIFHPASGSVGSSSIPSSDQQSVLFKHLFSEFLRIKDPHDRIERTSELLGRFGSWFDVADVLGQIPDSWPVESISAFLVVALRRIVQSRAETMVAKALSGAENLQASVDFAEKCEETGPHIIPATDTPTSMT